MAGGESKGPGGQDRSRGERSGRPDPRRPQGGAPGRRPGPSAARGPGPLRLVPIGGNRFELGHPACVRETEMDYEEGMEIRAAGDPEGARDALRYALAACRDNIWIHEGLGRIALEDFRDPGLARGHFGYAVELVQRSLPPNFSGTLPPDRRGNRPFYEAIDGLIRAVEASGQAGEVAELRGLRERLAGRPGGSRRGGPERPDRGG